MYNKKNEITSISCSTIVYTACESVERCGRDGRSHLQDGICEQKALWMGQPLNAHLLHYSTNTMGAHLHTGSASGTILGRGSLIFPVTSNHVCSKLREHLTKSYSHEHIWTRFWTKWIWDLEQARFAWEGFSIENYLLPRNWKNVTFRL